MIVSVVIGDRNLWKNRAKELSARALIKESPLLSYLFQVCSIILIPTKKYFQNLQLVFFWFFLKFLSSAQDLKSSALTLWNKLGADSLCSELSESCVILTLGLFFCEALQNFFYFLEFKIQITWPGSLVFCSFENCIYNTLAYMYARDVKIPGMKEWTAHSITLFWFITEVCFGDCRK